MMRDWNDSRNQLAAGVKEVGQLSSDTIKGYMASSSAGQKADLPTLRDGRFAPFTG